jgi:hypothetical protein
VGPSGRPWFRNSGTEARALACTPTDRIRLPTTSRIPGSSSGRARSSGGGQRQIPDERLGWQAIRARSLYLMLQNRIYRGEIVHKEQSYPGEHPPIIDQPLWDAVQAQLARNAAQHNSGARTRQPSLFAGMLFDGDGNPMTPSHAVKKGTRYRYYVSGPLITKDQTERFAGLRIAAAEIEQLVTRRVRQWLLDPGIIYKALSAQFPDPSTQQRLVARAAEVAKRRPELPVTGWRAVLTALIDRVDVGVDQIDIHLRPPRFGAFFDAAVTTIPERDRRRNPDPVRASTAAVPGGRSGCGSTGPIRFPRRNPTCG